MTTIQITCDNCGAKYKLPETFTSPKAKCQKCGSVIDVAAQREATTAETPAAAAKPAAAARPAVDRSKPQPAAPKAATKAAVRGDRAGGRRRRGGDDDGDADEGGRHGHRERHVKKKDNTPMIVGVVSLVAIVVVVIVFLMQKSDAPAEDTTAQGAAQAAPETPKPAAQPAAPTPEPEPEPDPEAAKEPDPKAAEASATSEELPPDAPRWMRIKIQTMDQVDTEFPDVPWDQLPADKKEDLQNKAADYAAGGRSGLDAEQWMREHPYEAMFGLLDHLRTLDHKNPMDMMQAYALNRFMTELTNGLQTGFVAVELDEELDPRKVQWNCMTTRAWLQFFREHPDAATFKEKNEERRKAQLKEGR